MTCGGHILLVTYTPSKLNVNTFVSKHFLYRVIATALV